jgi:hypothetical protein
VMAAFRNDLKPVIQGQRRLMVLVCKGLPLPGTA